MIYGIIYIISNIQTISLAQFFRYLLSYIRLDTIRRIISDSFQATAILSVKPASYVINLNPKLKK